MHDAFAGMDTVRVCAALLMFGVAGVCASEKPDSAEITWQEPIEVASGEATRGPWRMNDSQFLFVDDPTVAITEAGDIGVAWADQAQQDIFFQRYEAEDGNASLEAPVNVSGSPDIFSWLPRLVFSSDDPDRVYMLWQDIVFSGGSHGGEIFFSRSTDGGRSFSDPVNLSNTEAGAGKGRLTAERWHNGSLDLALAPDGTLLAAWTEYEGALHVSHSRDGGESFSEPVRVNHEGDPPARGPSLAVGDESAYLAWTVGEDENADIHLAKSDDGGRTFDDPRVVHRSEDHADAPKIAVDSTGTLHLVHAESPDGPWQHYHIRYSRSADGGREFSTPRDISGAHGKTFASTHFPALHLDGNDNLYVLWELFPQMPGRSNGLGLTCSGDGGQGFAEPVTVPASEDTDGGFNGSLQGLLMNKLAVQRDGSLAVVNSTFKPDEASHVWLFRGQAQSCPTRR